MTKDKALKIAIEFMNDIGEATFSWGGMPQVDKLNSTLNACKEALEQPSQKSYAQSWDDTHPKQPAQDYYALDIESPNYVAGFVDGRKSLEQPAQEPESLPPIERDEDMDRTYIPIAGGWEIQTKGKGSSFRICNTKNGLRWIVMDEYLHTMLENMAKENREATHPIQPLSDDEREEVIADAYEKFKDYMRHKAIQDINEKCSIEYWIAIEIEQAHGIGVKE